MKKVSVAFLLIFVSLVSLFAQGRSYTVKVAGSTSVSPLMELLVAEYGKTRRNVTFNISATGSGDGIKAVPAGTAEVGMSSRELSPAEIGTGIDVHLIA
ncbi:MAG: substrate-binding domain-containing protein, partial [Treponema sp.]|nr:substrate-binding domain-containing protein [Treponema sp.]